jgi:hypothetical protein
MKRKRREKKEDNNTIVRLSNRTNSDWFELLEGNDKRDINKISGPHRISSKHEKEIYRKIGYNQDETNNNTDETPTLSEENEEVVIDDDGEPIAVVPTHKHVITTKMPSKKSVKDSLTNGGIA